VNNVKLPVNLQRLLLISLLMVSPAYAADHCVILQYHHFSSSTPAITSVTPKQFEAQLNYLEQNNFSILPLREIIRKLEADIPLPEQCVALTVDDAWLSVYSTAFPMLKKRGWPMTVFVNSEAVDEQRQNTLNWPQMREMMQHGFSFENHGHSHDHLIRKRQQESEPQWLQRVRDNIITANKRITEELGIKPEFFAYPYGEYTPQVQQTVSKLGLKGFGQQSGPISKNSDFSALPRFPIAGVYAKLSGFITKVNSQAMPVVSASPLNPVLAQHTRRPQLTLKLDIEKHQQGLLNCFINGSAEVSIEWLDTATVQVKPEFDLPAGRSRTNCTMPTERKGSYYWYSHNWIRKKADGSWYQEY
jgi:peptidoglycan/xylan/chitin deacetylase (PgdA/CDA1 family)